jgi:hypothetical protein
MSCKACRKSLEKKCQYFVRLAHRPTFDPGGRYAAAPNPDNPYRQRYKIYSWKWHRKSPGAPDRRPPNLDVLLPRICSGVDRDRLFVLAFADENGASVPVDRIEQQSQRDADLKAAQVTLTVSSRMLTPFFLGDSTAEHTLTALATKLEEFMKSQIQSEVPCNE